MWKLLLTLLGLWSTLSASIAHFGSGLNFICSIAHISVCAVLSQVWVSLRKLPVEVITRVVYGKYLALAEFQFIGVARLVHEWDATAFPGFFILLHEGDVPFILALSANTSVKADLLETAELCVTEIPGSCQRLISLNNPWRLLAETADSLCLIQVLVAVLLFHRLICWYLRLDHRRWPNMSHWRIRLRYAVSYQLLCVRLCCQRVFVLLIQHEGPTIVMWFVLQVFFIWVVLKMDHTSCRSRRLGSGAMST